MRVHDLERRCSCGDLLNGGGSRRRGPGRALLVMHQARTRALLSVGTQTMKDLRLEDREGVPWGGLVSLCRSETRW